MNEATSRLCVILSLILSLISFLLSLIAFYLPNWKYIQFRSTSLSIFTSEDNPMDPLIRSEVEKYTDILYRRGDIHTIGLLTHCITGNVCGRNLLPSFDETNYEHCHNIKLHYECLFSNSLLSSKKCSCQKPSYISLTYTLVIFILILEILFLFVNFLRLYRRQCAYPNDIQLRIIAMISSLCSFVFLLIIIVQQNDNRLYEPLEFFRSMHAHYSRKQIYIFSKNLELILKQMEEDLDIRLGASYICMIGVLILTFIAFLTSSTVEIKLPSITDEEKNTEHNHVLIPSPGREHFIPSEEIRFIRQTNV